MYTVHGIFQAKIPEWVVFPFSRKTQKGGINGKSDTTSLLRLCSQRASMDECIEEQPES